MFTFPRGTVLFTILLTILVLGLGSCHQAAIAPAAPTTATASPTQVVGIAGTHFTLNGNPWLPQGVMIRGFVAPPAYLQQHLPTTYPGRLHYGAAELAAAQAFGADMLRFQVSQPALDAQSPLYDAQYVQDVVAALRLARSYNFVVIISMQDEGRSSEPTPHPLPIAQTVRDWDLLNGLFGTDRGVLFELYNEPELFKSAANWQLWAQGDPTATGPTAAIGLQTLLTHLRAAGSQNVCLLDGLGYSANTLEGVPTITDPLHRVAYAIHPYLHGSADESQWDAQFGIPSQTLPVLSTEWSAQAGNPLGLGQLPSYQPAVDLLNYLRAHNIPLGVGEFDVAGFMVQGVPGWTPSNYDNYTPAATATLQDAGMLVHNDFLHHYARPLTLADGL